jgi:tetratricopeptide (TPR) repeat protein
VIRERGFSPALLYDLANSYQRQGSTGRAILNYRRAQLLAPRDRDVAANLATARAASGLPAPALPAYRAVAQLLSATTWTWLAAGGLWLAAAALGVAALQRRWRRLLHPLAAAALLGGASAVAASALLGPVDAHGVIVAQKSAPLRLAPFDAAEVQWSLPEGEEVALGQRHGDFVQARDGEGHAGWLKSILVEPLIPRSR